MKKGQSKIWPPFT